MINIKTTLPKRIVYCSVSSFARMLSADASVDAHPPRDQKLGLDSTSARERGREGDEKEDRAHVHTRPVSGMLR